RDARVADGRCGRLHVTDGRARRRMQIHHGHVVFEEPARHEAPGGDPAITTSDVEGQRLHGDRQVPAVVVEGAVEVVALHRRDVLTDPDLELVGHLDLDDGVEDVDAPV